MSVFMGFRASVTSRPHVAHGVEPHSLPHDLDDLREIGSALVAAEPTIGDVKVEVVWTMEKRRLSGDGEIRR
jgi:hypothetical protein